MSHRRRIRAWRTGCGIAASLLLVLLVWQVAGLGRGRVPQPMLHPQHSARAADTARARQFAQLTGGLKQSQVAVKRQCDRPRRGMMACVSSKLVLRKNGKPVHPTVKPSATFTQVFPADGQGIAPAAGTGSTPPDAGTPAWIQQAYDLSYLSQTAGSGKTVAIVDAYDDPTAESDLATYRATYGLPPCTTANGCFTKVNGQGKSSPLPGRNAQWEGEIGLDLDAVSAICPNCKILLVEVASDLSQGVQTAASWPGVVAVSNSYGANWSVPMGGSWTAAGIPTVYGTGDWGSATGANAFYPAALPGVTAAGGTNLLSSPSQTGSVSNPVPGAPLPRGFVESAWAFNGQTGGGSGCNTQAGIVKPSYQTDTGCTGRSYADVSADADPSTGIRVYSTIDGGWVVYGGTSLSAPLVSAYLAITGANNASASPRWAYDSTSRLNDPSGGSTASGACQGAAYICLAGAGYDGPTGAGSISGMVTSGAPGIGGPPVGWGQWNTSNSYVTALGSTTASLTGGVYPNGLDTTYYWQYGTSTSYGSQTQAAAAGSGAQPVAAAASLTGLSAGATYHYRLVATNSAGTTYGYDYKLTTLAAPPQITVAPVIQGVVQQGQSLYVTPGTWSSFVSGRTYQWQRSTDSGSTWTDIPGASTANYVPLAADIGDQLRATVTASNSGGSGSATTAAVGPVLSGAPVNTVPPAISGTPKQGQTLSVSSSWNPTGTLTYQWQSSTDNGSTWANITGATTTTYTAQKADEGAKVRVTVTVTNAFGQASATSAVVGPVIADPPVNTAVPTISGTAQRTDTLSATQGTWAGTGNVYSYQWQRSADGAAWTAIAGATTAGYALTQADEGLFVRVSVTASNPDGILTVASASTTTIVAPWPPANMIPPLISGAATRGSTLSASPGSWTGPGLSYSYQWQHDAGGGFVNIPGATYSTYTLQPSDEDTVVRVIVAATNIDATAIEASTPTATIKDALPVNTSLPTISGTAQRDQTLSGGTGTWSGSGNTYAYQWQSSTDGQTWTDIPGATSLSYTIALGDEGSMLRLAVSATNADGTAVAQSKPTATVPSSAPSNSVAPKITGPALRGIVLQASQGTWGGVGNAYAYQWQRSSDNGATWTSITGANTNAYTLQVADETAIVRVRVTASNPAGTLTVASQPTAAVSASPPVNTTTPTVTGTAQRGQTLTGAQGVWSGVTNTYSWQWQRSADNGATWVNITGAVGSGYVLTPSDEGMLIRLQIAAANADGKLTVTTATAGPVLAAAPVNTVAPTLAGTPQRAQTLTGTQGTWDGVNNAYAYRWQRSTDGQTWANIAGAAALTYTIAHEDVGSRLRLQVTATNPDATAGVPAYSQATAVIPAAPPVNTVAPALTGTAQRGSVLTATQGTWSGINNTYKLTWQHSADNGATWINISSGGGIASGPTYTLATGDENMIVRVLVTASNEDGTLAVATNATALIPAAPPVNTAPPTLTGTARRGQTLTASAGTWNGLGNQITIYWQASMDNGATWWYIAAPAGGNLTGTTFTPDYRYVGQIVRIQVVAHNDDGTVTINTAPTAPIAAVPPVNTAVPTISGTAKRTFALTGTQGTWTGLDNVYAYQWQRSADGNTWTNIPGATDLTYTLAFADETNLVRLKVTASNVDAPAGVSAVSAPSTRVQGGAPTNTQPPGITGVAQRASQLSGTQGSWTGIGNAYSYQWQRSTDNGTTWTNITTGATYLNYTLTRSDENAIVRFQVTASNPDGTVVVESAASATVTAMPPVNSLAPTISGTAQRTNTLSLSSTGTWTGPDNAYAYQWQRSTNGGSTWINLTGASNTTYTLTATDVGAKIRALVTATNPDAPSGVSAASNTTATVAAAPPVNTTVPTLSGAAQRGSTLTAAKGIWSGPDNAYAYQWQHSTNASTWTNITSQTSTSYTLTQADELTYIRVLVTATNPDASAGVSAASIATSAVAAIPPQNTTPPSLSGVARLGGTLTASPGAWTPADATYAYQWQRSVDTKTWSTITGATSQSYTLQGADVGNIVRVQVTATNVDGSVSATSAATAAVTQPPRNLTRPNAPSGTLNDGSALSADHGTWDTSGASYAYQWMRCPGNASTITGSCSAIGAGPSYQLATTDIGYRIGVNVSATSAGGTSAPAASALTATVTGRPLLNTAAPTITGAPQIPNTLQGRQGTWNVALTGASFSWQRCDADGKSNCMEVGTSGQYTLQSADAGHTILLAVTATSPGQSVTARSTALTVTAQALPQATLAPTVTGTAQRTFTLASTQGTWTNNPTLRSQWQRCDGAGNNCAAIAGATGANYTLTQSDEGHQITVQVTATNSSGSTAASAKSTTAVAAFAPSVIHPPAITGIAYEKDIQIGIVANSATWTTTSDTTYATSWQRCDSAGQNCVTIPGATNGLYSPTNADVGHTLVAVITATNIDASVPSASKPTPLIADGGPRWKTLPLISNSPGHVGDAVTITPGTWSGPKVDTDVVQMMRCTSSCAATGPANATSYTIASADLGAILRVHETATNQGGSVTIWSARYVGPVLSPAAGAAMLKDAATVQVRNTKGQTLATAQLQTSVSANAARTATNREPARILRLRRARGIAGALQAWACPVSVGPAPGKCTARTGLRATATITLPASMTGRLRIVVVRRG